MIAAVCLALASGQVCANTVSLTSIKDNTLIENASGSFSNAKNTGIYSGRLASQGGGLRIRAILAFDLSSIPAGSTVTSASLTLWLGQGVGGNQTHSLYRVLANWGEGTSDGQGGTGSPSTPGDATWIHTFYPNSFWSAAGGDFVATASGSATVGTTSGAVTWSSAGMASDAQFWVNNPANNFGWILRGNESTLKTAKVFTSRESGVESQRPRLVINFTPPPPPCPADIVHNGVVDVNDLLAVVNAWGTCSGSCSADIAPSGGNGAVDVNDLLAIIGAWGNCP